MSSSWCLSAMVVTAAVIPSMAGGCATAGTYAVTTSTHPMEGGNMACAYPSTSNGATFPLLSFAHGDGIGEGGSDLGTKYRSMLAYVASSGFVVCAPLMCGTTSPIPYALCYSQRHIHQLNALVAAKGLGASGALPVRKDAAVGVFGHSTGGMTTLKCSAKGPVAQHGIGAALAYNGDGGSSLEFADVDFDAIEPKLPMLLITGTADTTEPKGSTVSNHDLILKANPGQPLLVGDINGEDHQDSIDGFRKAALKGAPYVVAFFAYTLMPTEACMTSYKTVLGEQFAKVSPSYFDNRLFKEDAETTIV